MINCKNVLGHPNQFEYCVDGKIVFQSYSSICAVIENGVITLGQNWDYSKTTLKHLKVFLGTKRSKKEIQKMIDDGIYKYNENL